MLAAMPQEHERGLGGWQAEWVTLPELVLLTAGASRAIATVLEGLVVHETRMRENLERTHGLIASEAVTSPPGESISSTMALTRLSSRAC